jgi:hypothetical protein
MEEYHHTRVPPKQLPVFLFLTIFSMKTKSNLKKNAIRKYPGLFVYPMNPIAALPIS